VGQCSDQPEACRFRLDKEDVYILFSGGLETKYSECAARLPAGTIMFIQVRPRSPLKLSDLKLDKRAFTSFNPSAPLKRGGFIGYRNQDGLVIRLFKKNVDQIVYLASDSDRNLCYEYYEEPESFVAKEFNHYAAMAVFGPDSVKAGETLMLRADSNINDICGYNWTLSVGRITSGQYTRQITIDTTQLAGQKIVITADIEDEFGHYMSSSRTVQVLQGSEISRLVGDWSGESICVNKEKFLSCNDEQVVYRIVVASGKTDTVTITADKIVNNKPVTMGTFDFVFDARRQTLTSEFKNDRVHIIFELAVKGDLLEGTLATLPDRTLVRRIKVKKNK
jgi:hypothetical protein